MSQLNDFSKKIDDNQFATAAKLETIIHSFTVKKIFIQQINNNSVKDYVITFPQKSIGKLISDIQNQNDVQKTVSVNFTLWGGGSSGIKGGDVASSFATGGYSSGTIVRFPLEILPGQNFVVLHLGSGGESFNLDEPKYINNGENSYLSVIQSLLPNAFANSKYRIESTSEGKTKEIEFLLSNGAGLDGEDIIQKTSTEAFFSFDGANSDNTAEINDDPDDYDHRNFYCPYKSKYDGYNSFIGRGGEHKNRLDADDNSGAGGAGYLPNVSKEYDKQNNLLPPRVGKGGDGGLILEHQSNVNVNIYAIGYIYVPLSDNKLTFKINDESKSINQTIEVILENKTYSIALFLETIRSFLPENSTINVFYSKLKIKMPYMWSVDTLNSSQKLLSNLGFTSNDNKTWSATDTQYEVTFSLPMYDICDVQYLYLL